MTLSQKTLDQEIASVLRESCGIFATDECTQQIMKVVNRHLLHEMNTSTSAKNTSASRKQAIKSKPRAGTQRYRILALIDELGPRTSDALEHLTGMPHTSCSARINEMVNAGWLEYDQSTEHNTRNGGKANPVFLTNDGLKVWQSIKDES